MKHQFTHRRRQWTIYKRKRDAHKPAAAWYLKIDNKPRSLQTDDKAQAILNAKSRVDALFEGRDKYNQFMLTTAARATIRLIAIADEWEGEGFPRPNGTARSANAQQGQKEILDRALRWWGPRSPSNITAADFHAFAVWRRNKSVKGVGNRSIDLELTTLSNLCNWAQAAGKIDSNPFSNRIRYTESDTIKHCHLYAPADDQELHVLTGHLIGSDNPIHCLTGCQLLFQALTGLRPGEPAFLRRDPGNLNGRPAPGQIFTRTLDGKPISFLAVQREKNGLNPAVKLTDPLQKFITYYLPWRDTNYPHSPYWFPHPKRNDTPLIGTQSNKTISKVLARTCEDLGLPARHAHGFRAYYVRVRRSQGIDDATISIELGHKGGPRLVQDVYGDPRDIFADGRCDWMPDKPEVRPAWEHLKQRTNIIPLQQSFPSKLDRRRQVITMEPAHIPIVTSHPLWRDRIDNAWTGKLGCYALYSQSKCLYVGKADDIAQRLRNHLSNRDDIDKLECWDLSADLDGLSYTEAKTYLLFAESILINLLHPLENATCPDVSEAKRTTLPIKVQTKLKEAIG